MLASMDMSEKVRENRLRRTAERQGFRLVKTRRLDHRAVDYGTYRLTPVKGSGSSKGSAGRLLTIDEVEGFLTRSPHGHGRTPGPAPRQDS